MREIKNLSKLDETEERGRKKYILSQATGRPILNSANARYRNTKYRKEKEKEKAITESEEQHRHRQQQSRETFEDFVQNKVRMQFTGHPLK